MATTHTLISSGMTIMGNKRVHIFRVSWDTAYPTNGAEMTAAKCGMAAIDVVIPVPVSGLFWCTWDTTYATVRSWTATGAESAAATGSFYAIVIGS